MTLVIQTNIPGRIDAWVVARSGVVIDHRAKRGLHHQSDRLLAMIDDLLRLRKIRLEQLDSVAVVRGPGPFTAVRTGLVVANTLSAELHLPIVGIVARQILTAEKAIALAARKKSRSLVRPWYGKGPNITKPKTRSGHI